MKTEKVPTCSFSLPSPRLIAGRRKSTEPLLLMEGVLKFVFRQRSVRRVWTTPSAGGARPGDVRQTAVVAGAAYSGPWRSDSAGGQAVSGRRGRRQEGGGAVKAQALLFWNRQAESPYRTG